MAKSVAIGKESVYTLKITLARSRPMIWRRVEVLGKSPLGELHRVIQGVMAWEESHLHEFVFGEAKRPGKKELAAWDKRGQRDVNALWGQQKYGDPLQELEDAGDEWGVTLAEAAPQAKVKFVYEYDFGDGWTHEIVVEKIGPMQTGADYPRCVAGKRRAPMEDSGSIWGWMEKIKVVNDPSHEEYEDLRGWMGLEEGEAFDAEWFDLGEANARMVKVIRECDRARKAWVKEMGRRGR